MGRECVTPKIKSAPPSGDHPLLHQITFFHASSGCGGVVGPPTHVDAAFGGGHVPPFLQPTTSRFGGRIHFSAELSVFCPSPDPPTAKIVSTPPMLVAATPSAARACDIG